jgi:hypothetical protein
MIMMTVYIHIYIYLYFGDDWLNSRKGKVGKLKDIYIYAYAYMYIYIHTCINLYTHIIYKHIHTSISGVMGSNPGIGKVGNLKTYCSSVNLTSFALSHVDSTIEHVFERNTQAVFLSLWINEYMCINK